MRRKLISYKWTIKIPHTKEDLTSLNFFYKLIYVHVLYTGYIYINIGIIVIYNNQNQENNAMIN